MKVRRALERLGILCYDVAKPMKECGCQETVFTNSLVGTKTGGRPGKASGKGVESSAEVKELTKSKAFRKSLKRASKDLLKTAQASIPVLTTGKTSPLYQALHGLSSYSVA